MLGKLEQSSSGLRNTIGKTWWVLVGAGLLLVAAACGGGADEDDATRKAMTTMSEAEQEAHRQEVNAWHEERLERLRQPDGWLTLVGLFWLEEGENTFGSGEGNDLEFPAPAPPLAGVFRLEEGTVTLIPADAVAKEEWQITTDGQPVTERELASDATGEPTVLALDTLRFYVIDREGRMGIRVRDHASPLLANFKGIERFPVDPTYRFDARFEPYDPPKPVEIPNILGGTFSDSSPGAVVFEYDGETFRLDATGDPQESLFLVFGDSTNSRETYGGGRFLYTEAPRDGRVVVDFNRAYNPPCVFTPYATCPLPPPQNKLKTALRAGEKTFGKH